MKVNDASEKLTEDEVIKLLMSWLESRGWSIIDFCLGHTRGIDITATKNKKTLHIEAKGAKASSDSPIKRRIKFDSGQIKDHLGKAIVKSIETRKKFPSSIVAVAHPLDDDLIKICNPILDELKKIQVYKFWVSQDNVITNLPI